ncbi:MAG: hypothetical protein KKG73_14565 [Gammaproteobacteria bacterium]|nr:hypothetical protein [Gammaproteobacteria bacterium]
MILFQIATALTVLLIAVLVWRTIADGWPIPPSKVIGENYLSRWHLIPRNSFFNIYLHKFVGSDDDRALHDHPWHSLSFLLSGALAEVTDEDKIAGCQTMNYPRFLRPIFRRRSHQHRLILLGNKPAWTLFITGPRKHFADGKTPRWFFYCPNGRKPWYTMTTPDGQQSGGCEE